jgi:hypothetical protein
MEVLRGVPRRARNTMTGGCRRYGWGAVGVHVSEKEISGKKEIQVGMVIGE